MRAVKLPSPRPAVGIFVRVHRSCTASTLPLHTNKSVQRLTASALTFIMGQALILRFTWAWRTGAVDSLPSFTPTPANHYLSVI